MESHGILSRYMRPGFKEGEDVSKDVMLMVRRSDGKITMQRPDGSTYLRDPKPGEEYEPVDSSETIEDVEMFGDISREEYENLGMLDKLKHAWKTTKKESDDKLADIRQSQIDYPKQRNEFFRVPGNYALYSRERFSDNPNMVDGELWDETTRSNVTQIRKEDFDPEKVRDGTQLIYLLDDDDNLITDGSSIFGSYAMNDLPFLFYKNSNDSDMLWDNSVYGKMLWGKDFTDDASFFDKWGERIKTAKRALAGGAATLPELASSTYRFLQPFDALGGVGPYDTFFPKNEAQKELVESSDYYYLPGYSELLNYISGDEDRPPGTTPDTFFPHNPELYKDELFDDEAALDLQYTADSRKDYKEKYSNLSDDQIISSMMEEYDVNLEDAQYYLNNEIKPLLNMTDKEFSSQAYMADRDNLMHIAPGAAAGMIPGMAIPLVGPVGITGNVASKVAPLSSLAKNLNKLNKSKKFRTLDKSSGWGIPQFGIEGANRELIDNEDEDLIYPEITVEFE
jgi:hypothetical protein